MSELTDEVIGLLGKATETERRFILAYLREHLPLRPLEQEWNTTADAILTAVARSTDLTLRGVRGILAEATFEKSVLPAVELAGWRAVKIVGDQPYDFLIERENTRVKIQVKLQRRELGVPKEYSGRSARGLITQPSRTLYVVEVQRTRSGKREGEATRPYRFGDFDILAVNLHPATGDWQRPGGGFAFVRTSVPPASLAAAVRRQIYAMDPDLPVPVLWSLDERLGRAYAFERNVTVLFLVFATIALLLASVGLYTAISHAVNGRVQEIGIRVAIGATGRDILKLVSRRGVLTVGSGLAIGLAMSFALNRVLKSQLVGVSPGDPAALVAASTLLVLCAVLGCWAPARRAMRVDPAIALKHE